MTRARNVLQEPTVHFGRRIAGTLSFGAALATILASAHSCGLIGDASASRRTFLNLGVHWVGILPAVDTLASLGDTARFVASITDEHGTALRGAALEWVVEDPRVATIDSAGIAVAHAPGTTWVMARVGEKSAKARVVVAPRMARLELPDSAIQLGEGQSRRLAARALDARGSVASPVPVTWSSSDTAVATISDAGVLAGVASGEADVSVLHGEAIATTHVTVTPMPGRLVAVDGDAQSAESGSKLVHPLRVRLQSRRGQPMAGVNLHFVPENGGVADPAYAITSADGIASTSWSLGAFPGLQRLAISSPDLDSALTMSAEAEPVAANTRVTPVGYPWSGTAGSTVPIAVAVQVTDTAGHMLSGVPVTWVALDSGSITTHESRTDSLGQSHASWTLARRAGVQRARVRVGPSHGIPIAPMVITALPGAPALLLGGDGNAQRGVAGEQLRHPLVVELRDEAGNGVEGISVAASVDAGVLSDSSVISDSMGRATFHWTLGTKAGRQQMVVRSGKLPQLTATVLADPSTPSKIEFLSPITVAAAGKPLGRPVRLIVTDAYGNRVTDRQVTISVTSGTVNPAHVMPAPDGTVTASWKLGAKRGNQVLTAEVRGMAVRSKFAVKVR